MSKIEGFVSDDETSKKLKNILSKTNENKKDWLKHRIEKRDRVNQLSFDSTELWVLIPSSEYNEAIKLRAKPHGLFIFERIKSHLININAELNFKNFWHETHTFHKLNDLDMVMFTDEDKEVIHNCHNIGKGFSMFMYWLLKYICDFTDEYTITHKVITKINLTLKLKSNS